MSDKGRVVWALWLLLWAGVAAAAVPLRLVTLAPHLTELVYAAGAGDRIVGTIDGSDFPLAARKIPRIGDVAQLDLERLVALRPDLVLVWGDGQPASEIEQLRRLRLPLLMLEQHTLADIPATVEQLGVRFGTAPIAAAAAADLRQRLRVLGERYAGQRALRVFWQVWSAPIYTLGGHHIGSEMLKVCGAQNIFAEQSASAVAVSEESVIARDPDVLLLTGTTAENADWLQRWRSRVTLRAIRQGAVVTIDPDLASRMGPRLVDATANLCESLAHERTRAH